MSAIVDIPELRAVDSRRHLIRIPNELDVPITDRVRRLIDTAEFRRLSQISQLGLVSLVYPAAHHTRFEHSLGVYRLALLYLKQLAHDDRFAAAVSANDAEVLIVAALLHDLGHWPFCHPIEDIHVAGTPRHEEFAREFILDGPVADAIREDWHCGPADVVDLLTKQTANIASQILCSILSGPIDIDKMDYLVRDSLHAGVPYGRNFDQQRLIGSLCLNESGNGIAITEKGRTAAEMMVFARYIMFSEVYWHHAVRGATAMLQRAFFLLHDQVDANALFRLTEKSMIDELKCAAQGQPAAELVDGLFGARRQLYKRIAQYSFFQQHDLYQRLARRPYEWLTNCSANLVDRLSNMLNQIVHPHEVLFDAPPQEREVEFKVEVFFPKEGCFRRLGDISPVVQTLALKQFDDYVKRVRVFVHPKKAAALRELPNFPDLLMQAVDDTER